MNATKMVDILDKPVLVRFDECFFRMMIVNAKEVYGNILVLVAHLDGSGKGSQWVSFGRCILEGKEEK